MTTKLFTEVDAKAAQQLLDACDWLSAEAATYGGRVLPIHLTPYISALPYRIAAIDALVAQLAGRDDTWIATGAQIVESWSGQISA